jgi:hypothetical protein
METILLKVQNSFKVFKKKKIKFENLIIFSLVIIGCLKKLVFAKFEHKKDYKIRNIIIKNKNLL